MKLKQQDIDYVESLTRKQSNCLIWHHVRFGRITASKIYVLHTDFNNPSISLIVSICKYQQLPIQTFQLEDGASMMKKITQYTDFQRNQGHKNFKVSNCGLVLYRENSFLGTSPNGIS